MAPFYKERLLSYCLNDKLLLKMVNKLLNERK